MGIAVGIDLGTTFSAIAQINEFGKPEVIKNSDGKSLTPSVVALCEQPPLVGDEAKALQALGNEGIASFFKRAMGDPHWILETSHGSYTPTDLASLVLKKLKLDAEQELKQPVTDAVITVPAYFNNDQREATKKAGELAGLNVLMMINEPTAAAIAFGLGGGSTEGKVLVYDLGGGTFDVSLIELGKDDIRVLATEGDHELGGKDWDDRIANYVAQAFYDEHGEKPLEDKVSHNDLLVASEQAKISLSTMSSTRVSITHAGVRAAYPIARQQLEAMTSDLLERTAILTENVLRDQNLAWKDLKGVLLVGGSTRMPMVREFVRRFGCEPMTGVNVDEAVALGAAIQANQMLGNRRDGKSYSLPGAKRFTDVTSHSLGVVAISEDRESYINSIIIRKNSLVPCKQSKPYQVPTRAGAQNELDVYILQGESETVAQCHVLGKYMFSGIRHVPNGLATIDIEYGYDENSVVTVTARENVTGRALSFTREQLPADMSRLSDVTSGRARCPYTPHAGQQRIPGALTDRFGNASGTQYDLADDNAFDGYLIAVLSMWGIDLAAPEAALQEKGFSIHRWSSMPDAADLRKVLKDACQLWLISGDKEKESLGVKHLQAIREFFESGRGLYLWGDNKPFYADANFVGRSLLKCSMSGDTPGGQVLGLWDKQRRTGFVSHLITTGIEHLYEGITVATIHAKSPAIPLMYGSDGSLLIALYDQHGRRAIIDGGFTRLYCNWNTAGTGRYVKNAASWLVNCERFGYGKGLVLSKGSSSKATLK